MYKNAHVIFLIILWSILNAVNSLQAQTVLPGIPFQMQARDRFNQAVRQQKIHVLSAIYFSRDTQLVYAEEQILITDEQGVFQFTLGKGDYAGGLFNSLYKIPWEKLDFRIRFQIAVPPQPPIAAWNYQQNWIELGTVPVGIVPYALYALQTDGSPSIKSKGRSGFLSAADSAIIKLDIPLEIDDGIAVTLEADRLPLSSPSYFIHRDLFRNQLLIFFTAPYTGFITWLIIN
jgi:hypothetical protein